MNRTFWKAAAIRAARTLCQTAAAMLGTGAVFADIDWAAVASASVLAAVLSLLTSVSTGLPEADGGEG